MFRLPLIVILILLFAGSGFATPSKFGDTGLINIPMAETHQSGSICISIWADQAKVDGKEFVQVPTAITLGLGAFIEAYGSYPNLLFNGDESFLDREFSLIGMKLRLLGDRSSRFKLALDGQLRQSVSDDPEKDGFLDRQVRVITSARLFKSTFLHLYGGTLIPDRRPTVTLETQDLYGAGLEYFLTSRSRFIAEVFGSSETVIGAEKPLETNIGAQYYLSPHLAVSLSYAQGLSDVSPDSRLTVGLFACQGTGIYIKPIKRLIEAPPEEKKPIEIKPEDANKLKIKTLMPRKLKSRRLKKDLQSKKAGPASKMMVEIDAKGSEVTLSNSEKLAVKSLKKGIGASALAVAGSAQAASAPSLPSTAVLPTTTPAVPTAAAVASTGIQAGVSGAPSVAPVTGFGGVSTAPVAVAESVTPAISAASPEKVIEKSLPTGASPALAPGLPSVGLPAPAAGTFAVAAQPSLAPPSPTKGVVAQSTVAKTEIQSAPQPKQIASSKPIKTVVNNRIRVNSSIFAGNGWELTEEGKKVLKQIADELKANKNWTFLRIEGFTDNVGSVAYNKNVSMKQATASANYLISQEGIDPNRLFIKGNGELSPISNNSTAEGRAANRRVEFLLLSPKGTVP